MTVHRIGILEDDPHVSAFFAATIDAQEDLEVAFTAATIAEAQAAFAKTSPDLCIVDLNLPDGHGTDFIRWCRASSAVRMLVATILGDRRSVIEALGAGADGYVLKSMRAGELVTHVRQTLEGFLPVSPEVARYLLTYLPQAKTAKDMPEDGAHLTPREVDLLRVFSRGLTYDETATALGISANTVRDHVKKIYAKLGVNTRTEALFQARTQGYLGGSD